MAEIKGKKLLILAGASVHVKLVEAAKEMGVYTIVTDYLAPEKSPAKQIADEHWELNITDIDAIVARCKEENVDGIIAGWIDPCQIPYWQICDKLGVPCYGTYDQFFKLTNKHAFKQLCVENGVDVIPEYKKEDIDNVEYPVFVKPVDSRGSRGQAICNNKEELLDAIKVAEEESSNGDILIEKYIANKNSFQVTYFFANGEPFILRTADGYKGLVEEKLDKVALLSVSPSVHTEHYMQSANQKVVDMMKAIGFENGPVMVQGFNDNGVYRFYDPGLRFPGVDFDVVYTSVYGVSVMKMMVEFALTGKVQDPNLSNNNVYMNGKAAAVLFPTIAAGKIAAIKGLDWLKDDKRIHTVTLRHEVGDEVPWCYNVNQRLAEINILADNKTALIELINEIYSKLQVVDTDGKDMLYCPLNTNRIE